MYVCNRCYCHTRKPHFNEKYRGVLCSHCAGDYIPAWKLFLWGFVLAIILIVGQEIVLNWKGL